jgi:hypothetical protein
MSIRIRYKSTTPFSFRKEQATTKFAATYSCPTPYAAKVALIIGGIRAGIDPTVFTKKVAPLKLTISPWGAGVVNTHMVKHWEVPRSDSGGGVLPNGYLSSTVVYREYLYFDGGVDLYVEDEELEWLRPALAGVNCFGKQGSFFVLTDVGPATAPTGGIPFIGSDMKPKAKWQDVSNFSGKTIKPRIESSFSVQMTMAGGGSKFLHLKFSD